MHFESMDLVGTARVCLSITSLVCAHAFWLRLREKQDSAAGRSFNRMLLGWLTISTLVALLFTHTPLVNTGAAFLPAGVAVGYVCAIASLFWSQTRRAFDQLNDNDIRFLMTFRMVFGAFLIAGAGIGLFPTIFALTAGTGDLLAGWLASVAPGRLDSRGSRFWRWLVHGWGALDLVDVAVLGTFVVRPWLVKTGSPGPSLLLPWVCVPLLFALNIHGLRRIRADQKSK